MTSFSDDICRDGN